MMATKVHIINTTNLNVYLNFISGNKGKKTKCMRTLFSPIYLYVQLTHKNKLRGLITHVTLGQEMPPNKNKQGLGGGIGVLTPVV